MKRTHPRINSSLAIPNSPFSASSFTAASQICSLSVRHSRSIHLFFSFLCCHRLIIYSFRNAPLTCRESAEGSSLLRWPKIAENLPFCGPRAQRKRHEALDDSPDASCIFFLKYGEIVKMIGCRRGRRDDEYGEQRF
jgi:hypothetical protein